VKRSLNQHILDAVFICSLILLSILFLFSKNEWHKKTLSTDGRGYYYYLPTLILNHDFSYQTTKFECEKMYGNEISHHTILKDKEGNHFNKTFPGVAIWQTPGFLVASGISYIAGQPVNGFNKIYMFFIAATGLLALLIGYFFLRKLLISYSINKLYASIIIAAIIYGSNVYYYGLANPSMAHVYSFASISVFLWFCRIYFKQLRKTDLYKAFFMLGLIFLLRPTNVLILLFVPFFAEDKETFISIFRRQLTHYKELFIAVGIAASMVLILPFLWKIQTGHWFIWNYANEGFYWGNPKLIQVLFSFRNGLFIWSPILMIALFMFLLSRIDYWKKIIFLLFFFVNLYVISAWWTFYYGGGFGHRAWCDFVGVFIIVFALSIDQIKFRKTWHVITLVLIGLSIFQGAQLSKGIISNDYMNWEAYKLSFLKYSNEHIGLCHATLDIKQFGEVESIHYKKHLSYDSEPEIIFDANREYGGDGFFISDSTENRPRYFFECNLEKMVNEANPFHEVMMVIEGTNGSNVSSYITFPLYHIHNEAVNEWKNLKFSVQLEDETANKFRFYIWNKAGRTFKIKNLDYQIKEIR